MARGEARRVGGRRRRPELRPLPPAWLQLVGVVQNRRMKAHNLLVLVWLVWGVCFFIDVFLFLKNILKMFLQTKLFVQKNRM